MKKHDIITTIKAKQSCLCVGLDTDIDKLPDGIEKSNAGLLAFNKEIIEATLPFAVAYKLNSAFYEKVGAEGWNVMFDTVDYIKKLDNSVFIIADAKRGDIGNTSSMYADAFLNNKNFDAITVAPYMGKDSVTPFLANKEKWVILLALTSNPGSDDFQKLKLQDGEMLFERVLKTSQQWASDEQMMYVVGATQVEWLANVRAIAPNHFLLVPGIGAQGGSMEDVFKYAHNNEVGLLINASRSVIYASTAKDFATAASKEAKAVQNKMSQLFNQYSIL